MSCISRNLERLQMIGNSFLTSFQNRSLKNSNIPWNWTFLLIPNCVQFLCRHFDILFNRTPFLSPYIHSFLLALPPNQPSSIADSLFDLLLVVFKDCNGVLFKRLSMNLLFLINNHSTSMPMQYLVYLFLIYLHNTTPNSLATNKTIFKEIGIAGKKAYLSSFSLFILHYALLLSSDQQKSNYYLGYWL